jgi:hypothetical protein
MDQSTLLSSRDTLLIAIPLVLMVFLSAFRLDHLFAAPKASPDRRRPFSGVDKLGEPILCDPDGRPSGTRRRDRRGK